MEQTIEVRLDRAPSHLELRSYLCVVTALQQQFRNLLLSRAQANRLFLHVSTSSGVYIIIDAAQGSFPQIPCCGRPSPPSRKGKTRFWLGLPKIIALKLPSEPDFLSSLQYPIHACNPRADTTSDPPLNDPTVPWAPGRETFK
jgi:hypothetical protein